MQKAPAVAFVFVALCLVAAANGAPSPSVMWEAKLPGVPTLNTPPVVSSNGEVVFYQGGDFVTAFNRVTGRQLWTSAGFKFNGLASLTMEPFTAGASFVFVDKSTVYALDIATGHKKWSFDGQKYVYGYYCGGHDLVLYGVKGQTTSHFTYVNTDTGSSTELMSVNFWTWATRASLKGFLIAVYDGDDPNEGNATFVAFKSNPNATQHGQFLWKRQLSEDYAAGGAYLAFDDQLVVGHVLGRHGTNQLIILNSTTGDIIWDDFSHSMQLGGFLAANGSVGFFAGTDSNTTAVNLLTQEVLWTELYQPDYIDFMRASFKLGMYAAYIGKESKYGVPFSIYSQATGELLVNVALPTSQEELLPGIENYVPPALTTKAFFFLNDGGVNAASIDLDATPLWSNLTCIMPQSANTYPLPGGGSQLIVVFSSADRKNSFITSFDVSVFGGC